jgi:hypothetical protein
MGRLARRRRACRTKPVFRRGVVYSVHTTPRFSSNRPLPASKAQRETEVLVIGALPCSVVQVLLPPGNGLRGSYKRSFRERPSYSPRWILLWQDAHTGTCFLFKIAITRVNPFEFWLVRPFLTCRTWCIAISCVSPHMTQGHPSFDLVRRRTFIRTKSTSGESVKAPLLVDQSVFL